MIDEISALTLRNLAGYRRRPDLIVAVVAQPVALLVLFRYGLGGALDPNDYADFLVPGMLALAAAFTAINTGIGLSTDLDGGFVERLRALPINPLSVVIARAAADVVRYLVVAAVLTVAGVLVGFEPRAELVGILVVVGLLGMLAAAFSAIGATVALWIGDPETTQSVAMLIVFPTMFASSVLVPTSTLPGWLQALAKLNPITHTANAIRALLLDSSPPLPQAIAATSLTLVAFGLLALLGWHRATR
jgi:ABC-2 type transport system permease protein/oleandomycin transport system permease protein